MITRTLTRTLTGNWRLRSRERVWGRPWVIFEVEEHVTGQPIAWLPYHVDKLDFRPATTEEAEACINRLQPQRIPARR